MLIRLHMLALSRVRLAALAFVPCLIACGGGMATAPGDNPSTTPPPSTATVQATPSIQFTPGNVTLAVGGTVTFAFGTVAHNLYFDNAPAGAPANITTPTTGASVTRTFPTAGTFAYNCHIHPGMTGTIVVR